MPYEQAVGQFLKFWDSYNMVGQCVSDFDKLWHPEDSIVGRDLESGVFLDHRGRLCGHEPLPVDRRRLKKIIDARKGAIVRNLGPVPYCGNLLNAPIIVLQCNPSVSPASVVEIGNLSRFCDSGWRREQHERMPFRFIDSSFANVSPGGVSWWLSHLAPAVAYVSRTTGMVLEQVWLKTAQTIATIDLVAYRSATTPIQLKKLMTMQSSVHAQETARAVCEAGKEVFIHYGVGHWRGVLGNEFLRCNVRKTSRKTNRPEIIGNCPVFRAKLLAAIRA